MDTLSQHPRACRILLSASLLCAFSVPASAGDGTGKSTDVKAPNTANANATAPKPDREKKIYTNDDVEALARNLGASTVGNPAPIPSPAPTAEQQARRGLLVTRFSPAPPPLLPEKDPIWYAQQYAALSARLDGIDSEVERLRTFRVSDAPPGSVPGIRYGLEIYGPCPAIATDTLIRQLLQQRAQVAVQISALEDRARANDIAPEVLRNAPQIAASAEGISRLPPPLQAKVVLQKLQQLESELNEVREVKSKMENEAAAQHMTLLPETKYGGGFTADYLKQLDTKQNQIAQQLDQVEDQALRAGIPPRALP